MTDSTEPQHSDATPQQRLRERLKEAVRQGVLRDFTLRAGGRATLYPADGPGKFYTTSVLDTLAAVERIASGEQL